MHQDPPHQRPADPGHPAPLNIPSAADWRSARAAYPLLDASVYVNTAAMQPLATTVRAELERVIAQCATGDPNETAPFPPDSFLREGYARLAGCTPGDLTFAVSTTDALLKALWSFPWRDGDELLVPRRDFPSVTFAARSLQGRGVRLRWITGAGPEEADVGEDDLLGSASGCRAALFSWVHYLTGRRVDLSIAARLKERGVEAVFVDGMQGFGPCLPRLSATDVDVFAWNSVKWIGGPAGAAAAYVAPRFLPRLEQAPFGWWAADRSDLLTLDQPDLPLWPDARRMDGGSPPHLVHSGVSAYLRFHLALDPDAIERRSAGLSEQVRRRLTAAGFPVLTPADPASRAAIVTFRAENAEARFEALRARGIFLSLRRGLLRVSPYFFNTAADLDALIAALGPP